MQNFSYADILTVFNYSPIVEVSTLDIPQSVLNRKDLLEEIVSKNFLNRDFESVFVHMKVGEKITLQEVDTVMGAVEKGITNPTTLLSFGASFNPNGSEGVKLTGFFTKPGIIKREQRREIEALSVH